MTKDEIALRLGAALAVAPVGSSPVAETFGKWDAPDLIALATATPDLMITAFGTTASDESGALYREGARGPTARSAIAKEIAIQRRLARFAQSLLGVELERFAKGRIGERRLRAVEAVADRVHKRYLASYALLLDMEAGPAPTFRITAGNAAIQVNQGQAST